MANRKRGNTLPTLLILVAITAVLYWFSQDNSSNRYSAPPSKSQDKFITEKTGAGAIADFTQVSIKVHSAVDSVLGANKITISSQQDQKREVPRQAVEGLIRWHTRHLVVILPDGMSKDKFRDLLIITSTGGGEVIEVASDQYQGQSATRYDVGIRDKLAGDTVTLITDKIYVVGKKQSAAKVPDTKDRVPARERAQLAIVIDDFGYTGDPIGPFTSIDRPLTFAVLPHQPHTQEAASRGLAAGQEIFLHLPMEPLSPTEHREKTTITTAMGDQEIQQTVMRALANVPGVSGINNHQGSKATADQRVMKNVLTVVKGQQLLFIDSRTSGGSIAYKMAKEMNITSGENYIFLDNSSDVEAIKQQLRYAGRIAIRENGAIAIGHARPATAVALQQMIPELEADGIKLVFASQLLKK